MYGRDLFFIFYIFTKTKKVFSAGYFRKMFKSPYKNVYGPCHFLGRVGSPKTRG